MVQKRLKLRGVSDPRVLAAMDKVDRARFVPPDMQPQAYDDRALGIGFGQTISQPYIVALMSELLELQGHERVLEIGAGSGYQTALLAELAQDIYSLEIVPELAARSSELLKKLGYKNIHVRQSSDLKGWKEMAPFEAIIVTCAPERLPSLLIEQLADDGRLVIPIGAPPKQMLTRFRKTNGELTPEPVIPVSFVPMTGDLQ